jgi:phosphoribosylformylglycinamidine cyclo-ligase
MAAQFCVGIVQEDALLGPELVREGDVLIGLPSSGLHANGYSLVRAALLDRFPLDETPPGLGRSLADELLEPCAIYSRDVLAFAADGLVHAAAHITGGGFVENIPRALPPGLGARIHRGSWPEPPIFALLADTGGLTASDLFSTFNMGIGMVLVTGRDEAEEILQRKGTREGFVIGEVVEGSVLRIEPPDPS